jgi:hypothetical protein
MLNPGTHDGLADIGGKVLGRKFGRVNANHYQLIRELLTEPAQLRDVVVAVYSGVGPEFEQDDLAAQRLH